MRESADQNAPPHKYTNTQTRKFEQVAEFPEDARLLYTSDEDV
jgi:hypothetical protein